MLPLLSETYLGNSDSMPSPFLQCITTLSPGLTVVTPSPICKTFAPPSCPNKQGKNSFLIFTPDI